MAKAEMQVLHLSPYSSLVDWNTGAALTLCGLRRDQQPMDANVFVGDLITDPVDPASEVACPKCFSHPDYPLLLLGVS
jgi:hypothetical protein